MGRKKSVDKTIKYYLGWQSVLCDGPVDEILQIEYSERTAFSGVINSSGPVYINKPNLLGGEAAEGGWQGTVDVMMGEDTQTPNEYLESQLGAGEVPAYRGVTSLVFRQFYFAARNPYLKDFWVKLRRIPKWYPAKAGINGHSNAAHIIYECLTNPNWGLGSTLSEMDDIAFRQAADTCFNEGMGLSIQWANESTIEEFIDSVLDHMGAVRYQHRETGRWVIKMIRGDYDTASLKSFDESNIVSLKEFQRAGAGETVNEVTVTYTEESNGKDTSVTLQNLASIAQQGAIVKQSLKYPGIPTAELANRVAKRELDLLSYPLASCQIIVNWDGEDIYKGDVIKLSWKKLGLVDIPFRVNEISLGTVRDGKITLSLVEDAFGLPSGTYSTVATSKWVKPVSTPADVPLFLLQEMPYYFLATLEGEEYAESLPPGSAFCMALAARNSGLWRSYELHADDGGGYQIADTFGFSAYAEVSSEVSILATTIEWVGAYDEEFVEAPFYAQVGDELVYVTAVDFTAKQLTVQRGALDTLPVSHSAGTRIWLAADDWGLDFTERLETDAVSYKALPQATESTLELADATAYSIVLGGRINRPLPPANVKFNGDYFPENVTDDVVITWAHRNRLQQTAGNVLWTEDSIGPEPGVTYTIEFVRLSTVLRKVVGLTEPIFTYTPQDEVADSGSIETVLTVRLWAVRDGYDSYQVFEHTFDRTFTSSEGGLDLSAAHDGSSIFDLTGVAN